MARAWTARPYLQILRNDPPTKRSYFNVSSYAFHGPALDDGDTYRKLNQTMRMPSVHRSERRLAGGAAAPLRERDRSAAGSALPFTLNVFGDQYLLAATGPAQTVAPGRERQFTQTLFVGPKLQAQLEATAPDLGRVADYGRLWFLAQPLFRALSVRAPAHRQLGHGDHRRHVLAQAVVLSAVGGERALDGEDEDAAAAHQEHAGDLRG